MKSGGTISRVHLVVKKQRTSIQQQRLQPAGITGAAEPSRSPCPDCPIKNPCPRRGCRLFHWMSGCCSRFGRDKSLIFRGDAERDAGC